MLAKLAKADQMTVEEFLAYMESRPDGERWELIEGVAIMNASPTQWHQIVTTNIVVALRAHKMATDAAWMPIIGVGTLVPVSPNSLPQPDVYVQAGAALDSPTTDDAVVIFEVLSKSNTKVDQAWRKRVYTSIPNCQHYVTVAMKKAEIVRYDRADGWAGTTIGGLDGRLQLPAIDAVIASSEIYRWTPIA